MSECLFSLYTYASPWSSIRAFSTLKTQIEESPDFCKKAKAIAIGIIASIGASIAGVLTLGLAITPTFRWIVSLFYPLEGLKLNDVYARQNLAPLPPAAPPRRHIPQGVIHKIEEVHFCPSAFAPGPGNSSFSIRARRSETGDSVALTFKNGNETYPFTVTICNQDLFESGAEVLVDTAEATLQLDEERQMNQRGGAIYREAYQRLQRLYEMNFPSGAAALLPSGDLQNSGSSHVAIVGAPTYEGGLTSDDRDALYSCYYNALLVSSNAGKTSIAFPAICAEGAQSFPAAEAVRISVWALFDFIRKNPDSTLKTISIHSQEIDETHRSHMLDYLAIPH